MPDVGTGSFTGMEEGVTGFFPGAVGFVDCFFLNFDVSLKEVERGGAYGRLVGWCTSFEVFCSIVYLEIVGVYEKCFSEICNLVVMLVEYPVF